MDMKQLYQVNPVYQIKERAGEIVLEGMPGIGTDRITYSLNDTALFFMGLFIKSNNLQTAVMQACQEYNVSPDIIREDLKSFVKHFYDTGVLMKVAQ